MGQLLLLAAVFLGTVGVLIGGYLFINRRTLAQADAALDRMTPASFILRVLVSAVIGFALGAFYRGAPVGVLGGVVGFMIPIWWLKGKQKKRLSLFRDQLPDAIDMLVSAMKAGYSFQA